MADKYTIEVEKRAGQWFVETEGLKGVGHTMWQALSMLCGKIREHEKEDPAQDKLPNV